MFFAVQAWSLHNRHLREMLLTACTTPEKPNLFTRIADVLAAGPPWSRDISCSKKETTALRHCISQ